MAASDPSLTDLGVNIYDQNELEADIIKQLDQAAEQQATEQQSKFAEKELRSIQRTIRQIKTEENGLTRQINSLLLKPLIDVVLDLKELKRLREEKRLKLDELEKREKELMNALSTSNFKQLQITNLLNLPSTSNSDSNNEQLIRTGLMTPFGTTITTPTQASPTQTPPPLNGPSLAEFDWLGKREESKGKGGSSKNKRVLKKRTESPTSSSSTTTLTTQNESRLLATKNDKTETHSSRNESEDSYRPHPLIDSDSSYTTDEELGPRRKKRKRGEKEEEESEDEYVNWKKGGTSKGREKDDGDDSSYRKRIKSYKAGSEDSHVDVEQGFKVPSSIWNKLYRYQQTGVRWLWELHSQQAGGIMGDEMGLGKTIQTIAFLSGLKISNVRSHVTRELGLGPVLLVCPATVLQQWVVEFHKWYPPFRVAIFHDTGSYSGSRNSLLHRIVSSNGVMVTTYASIRLHNDLLTKYPWEYLVLDEGHKIRNPDAEITLACKQFATPHRIILSGSPMQNNLRELWSLFDFVFPGKLGTLPVFMEQFSVPITLGGYANASQIQVETAYRCACILRDTINPYLLRRLKSDVKLQLPDKNEQVLFCRLTDYQRELYEEYIKGPEVEAMMCGGKRIFAGLMTLRKLSNHPDLVTKDYKKDRTLYSEGEGEGEGERDTEEQSEDELNSKRMKIDEEEEGCHGDEEKYGFWRRSGKMIVVEALLKIWKKENHKVLLFTQTRQMLFILQNFLISNNYTFLQMDGTTSVSSRQTLIKRFNEDPSIYIFLLTTRVGGLGINLTGADRVLIYDPDWNPSTDIQARERAWRIGQTKPVTIYRLLTSGTIEEKVYHRQIFKQFLTNRVLRDPRQRRFFKTNDLYELFTLGPADGSNKTETSAMIAGTGSEIKPSSLKSRQITTRKKKGKGKESIATKRITPSSITTPNLTMRSNSSKTHNSTTSTSTPTTSTVISTCTSDKTLTDTSKSTPNTLTDTTDNTVELLTDIKNNDEVNDIQTDKTDNQLEENLMLSSSSITRQKKKKKKKRKRKQTKIEIEGHHITGLDNMDTFNPGSEDEENKTTNRQDDIILRKLFKKSGVESAVKHDALINDGDPDSAIIESEASKIAQSAARAMRDSYRINSHMSPQWGQPTWTGLHGTAGAPRFGESSKDTKITSKTTSHFSGQSQKDVGSLTLSSSVLLNKMRSRNVLSLTREEGQSSRRFHSNDNQSLLKDLRAFIAHQAKRPGKATTDEILTKFKDRLNPADTAVFRSMLREICDFERYHGDGLWTLKYDYR